MKTKEPFLKKLSLTILLFATLGAVPSFGGHAVGNGGDSLVDYQSWFLDPQRTIKSCLLVAANFGLDTAQVKNEIQSVYGAWRDYLQLKRLNWELGSTPVMSTNISLAEQCDGTEDLTFYFGVENESVKAAKKQYTKPFAFAEKQAFDQFNSWAKGFIWVAGPSTLGTRIPDWTVRNTLHGILLHEVGHTMGNGHIEGTIMDEGVGSWLDSEMLLGSGQGSYQWALTHIDHERELLLCRKCGVEFIAYENDMNAQNYFKEAFKKMTGNFPVGSAVISFSKVAENKDVYGKLVYTDSLGKTEYELQTGLVAEAKDSAQIFRALYHNMGWGGGSSSYSYYGTLKGVGKTIPVIANRNMGSRLEIKDLSGPYYGTLFKALLTKPEEP